MTNRIMWFWVRNLEEKHPSFASQQQLLPQVYAGSDWQS